ncbi:MAG: amidohydrolase family protein [Desulfomonilia bacterium]
MREKTFFDIHCHAMNLSHPSLLGFVKNMNIDTLLFLNSVPIVSTVLSKFIDTRLNRVMNLLSVMERDLGDVFLLMEKDMEPFVHDGRIEICGSFYDRVVLTPLMMDFGYKGMESYPGIHYRDLPKKPIVEQVIDLFNGIRKYARTSGLNLFEIYPFLGINTRNYDMEGTSGSTGLPGLLEKYFGSFLPETLSERRARLLGAMGMFSGDIEHLRDYSFAGIKVYPPLGFDPWPADDSKELAKVEYLYEFCAARRIPITVHCSDGGYRTHKQAKAFTDPEKWARVLSRHPELKLNLAHFGKQDKAWGLFPKRQWQQAVIGLIAEYDHVYTDFSCCGFDEGFYARLSDAIHDQPSEIGDKLRQRILFGTDFMINLLWIDSYRNYLDIFSRQRYFRILDSHQLCSLNPQRFLFE